MWQIVVILVLSYLLSKVFTRSVEAENDALKSTIKMLKRKHLHEKEKYQDRMNMMNKALEQWEQSAR